jgi:hypothetical protein
MSEIKITAISNAAISSGSLSPSAFNPSYEGLNSLTLPDLENVAVIGDRVTASVPIQVGSIQVGSPLVESTKSFRWALDDFEVQDPNEFSFGDIVFFEGGINSYNSAIKKVDIMNLESGASKGLFIFESYDVENRLLKVVHRGFVDLPLDAVESFSVGSTLYVGENNKFSTEPTSVSGSWVRSVGLCVPSTETEIKRIWLDPDSTYILLV